MDLSSISGYYSDLANQVPASGQKISQLSEEELKTKSDEELMEVCKQFESYFLEQVFKEMAKTTSLLERMKMVRLHRWWIILWITPLPSWQASQQSRTVWGLHRPYMSR